jgi:hypothetical protein
LLKAKTSGQTAFGLRLITCKFIEKGTSSLPVEEAPLLSRFCEQAPELNTVVKYNIFSCDLQVYSARKAVAAAKLKKLCPGTQKAGHRGGNPFRNDAAWGIPEFTPSKFSRRKPVWQGRNRRRTEPHLSHKAFPVAAGVFRSSKKGRIRKSRASVSKGPRFQLIFYARITVLFPAYR